MRSPAPLLAAFALSPGADAFHIPSARRTVAAGVSRRHAAVHPAPRPPSRASSALSALPDLPSLVTAYSDDPLGDLLFGANGLVIAGVLATAVGVGATFYALLPKVGSASFDLTAEEQDAVDRVDAAYDAKPWEREVTEEGSKGYVNRRRQANEAKEKYQERAEEEGVSRRELKDRSLRYSEADLGFIAGLLRAADPAPGDVCFDLGCGTGRSTAGFAAVYPQFSKVIGVEFLAPLTKLANGYRGKVKGKKAALEYRTGDFAEEDLSGAGCVFVGPANYLSDADLAGALETLPSGAAVMTIDKRLGGEFTLVTEVEDPSGDLVLNTGYVYRKK